MRVAATNEWFAYLLPSGQADLCSAIVGYGIAAGVGAVILFFALLTQAFKALGAGMAHTGSDEGPPDGPEYLLWGLGVMLSVHVFNWLGITYFDQTKVYWFMQLASISSLSGPFMRGQPVDAHGRAHLEPEDVRVTSHAGMAESF